MDIKANAKINLYLDVIGKRDDGYHTLKMVILPIKLHDTLSFEKISWTKSHITCDTITNDPSIKYNLIDKSIRLFQETYQTKENYSVIVHKEIPVCAGLGGGSSNAATTFRLLNKTTKTNAPDDELAKIGLSLGADIPFFIYNKPAKVEGVGENITPITIKKNYFVLIVMPATGCSTKAVFEEADKIDVTHGDINKVVEGLETGNDDLIAEGMNNSLENVSAKFVPEIKEIKTMLINDGLKMSMMSGSGSSVFGLSDNKKLVKKLYKKYNKNGFDVYLTKVLK